ncbi:CvpA family protein [candidate division KSB1 bacterium]|nr:CvpA family protein [candidate division KSB1 bacterium]
MSCYVSEMAGTIDLIIGGFLVLFILRGLRRGLVKELFGLGGLVAAFLLARWLYLGLAQQLNFVELSPPARGALAFFLIFIGVMIGARVVAVAVQKILRFALLGWLDRLGGALFGLGKGGLVIAVLILIWAVTPYGPLLAEVGEKSPLLGFFHRLISPITESIETYKKEGLQKLGETLDPGILEKIKTPVDTNRTGP